MNDDCEDATAIGNGSFEFTTINSSDDGPSLPPECDEGNGRTFRRDVWVRYIAPCTGTATASVCESDFSTRLAIYDDGDCPGPFVACNDNACGVGDTRSRVSFPVEAGGVYLIRIGARPFEGAGTGTLEIGCSP